jgi:hypothetical protein
VKHSRSQPHGLGVIGVADVVERLGLSYESGNPEIATDELAAEIQSMIIKAVAVEEAYSDDLLPHGILGLAHAKSPSRLRDQPATTARLRAVEYADRCLGWLDE